MRGAPDNNGDRWLRAHVDYKNQGAECGHWRLSDGLDEGFLERFDMEATRAGVALKSNLPGDGRDVWLHVVFSDLLDHGSKLLFAAKKGEGGIILRACEASAIYCARLEKQSLDEARKQSMEPVGPVRTFSAQSPDQISAPRTLKSEPTDQMRRESVIKKVQNPQLNTILSTPDAALYFEVQSRTIHRWVSEGKLRSGARRGSITIESICQLAKKRSRKRASI